jgi:putative PIN family toxin of toxin-antitoxin system
MRAVVDTNVLISGFLSRSSFPAKIVDGWVFHLFTPVVLPELMQEYTTVLARNKFSILGPLKKRMLILQGLLSLPWVVMVYPEEKVELISADKKDNMFLECALAGSASVIISGDAHLLGLNTFRGIQIFSAREFVQKIETGKDHS